ncbi:helix-turn-helix domain-containing protein, partial [Streptomyces sp. NPDC004667]|uniref:helix-turn-helix domain-containing protein n=1 Tax=Streptomyces sp. NPDC004667 TaxID=3154285 RepID=UPI0033AE3559
MNDRFGALLRGLRLEAGMTQEQLAERSRLGVRTIHRLETGKPTDARMGTVKQVAHALADALRRDRDGVWTELLAAQRGTGTDADTGAGGGTGTDAGTGAGAAVGSGSTAGDTGATAGSVPARPPEPAAVPPRSLRAGPLPPSSQALAGVADALALDVYGRCVREEEQRRVHDPFPLPVRWRPAPEDLLDRGDGPGGPASPQGGPAGIADVYRRVRSGRLLVLGRAGSGKTVLVLRFVTDYLAGRSAGEPVPVVFSIGSWDPAVTTLRDWLIERLLRDHPGLDARAPGGSPLASALVDAGWILPVLDGFDEIATGLLGLALRELNTSALPLLLTSRTERFAEAVAVEGLRRTAGIELMDLDTEDLVHYLPRTARPAAPATPGTGAGAPKRFAAQAWKAVTRAAAIRSGLGDQRGS